MAKEGRKSSGAREIALQVLLRVETQHSYANLLLDQLFERREVAPVERHLATELVYGVLRWQNAVDWIISRFTRRELTSLPAPLRNILRLGVYQIMYLNKVPDAAACNTAVELAKSYGHPGTVKFANGVLRAVARGKDTVAWPPETDPVNHIAVKYSHPAWLVERWLGRYGQDETIALCRANNQAPPLCVRVNTLRTSRATLLESFRTAGVTAEESELAPDGLRIAGFPPLREFSAYREGLFQVQDESSMLVAEVASPLPGEVVIDTCSAPGGKTTHLAQKMGNQGRIYAVDLHPQKLGLVEANCRRLGIGIVETRADDATTLGSLGAVQADRVLVDAPCSGLGVLRRKPDAKWRKTAEQLKVFHALQLSILETAAQRIKPGGILVYSTCTTEPDENEAVIAAFLRRQSGFAAEHLAPFLPAALQTEPTVGAGYLQLLPHIHGTDGFFIARLRREH